MDPIADMLTTIRNAVLIGKFNLSIPYSNVKWHMLRLWQDLRLVEKLEKDETNRAITFTVVQEDGKARFRTLKRLSTPGKRIYAGWKEIPRPRGNGLIIVSTSQGMMTGKLARNRHLGGELICEIS